VDADLVLKRFPRSPCDLQKSAMIALEKDEQGDGPISFSARF
jgi:hypothetical protein